MFRGECRRSPRIVELDARKAEQARSRNKSNVILEVIDEEELDKGQDTLKRKRGRKKVKVRTVQDLVVNSVDHKVQKTDTGNAEDNLVNAAFMPSGAITDKSKLELLLAILKRRDTHKIFAEPVDPEEVEYYYEVIKEPMDFGTIAKKLNEGKYQMLEEFEHDVFLVPNNALLFNASNTVYYRQARALKELATRLFHALKTDPGNFGTEASQQRVGPGRRPKDEARNLNCINKNNSHIAASEYRAQRGFDDSKVDRRQTYRPWNSFSSANGALVSAVYDSPQQLELNEKVGLGYVESLKRFAKDMGPIVQMTVEKKVNRYFSEAVRLWNEYRNRQMRNAQMQISRSPFVSKIKVSPSFIVPPSTLGCQNISGDKINIHGGSLNGGEQYVYDSTNINNAFNGGINQLVSQLESFSDFRGGMTQSTSSGFAPALHLPANSNWHRTFEGERRHGQSSFWNGGNVSVINNMGMNDALNKGKGKLVESPDIINDDLNKGKGKLVESIDFQEVLVQPNRGGIDGGVAFKDYFANRSSGIHLGSPLLNYNSGKGKIDLTDLWNATSNEKMTGLMVNAVNVDNAAPKSRLASLWPRMLESMPTRNSGASSSSPCPPAEVMTRLNINYTVDNMTGIGPHSPVIGVCQKDDVSYGEEGYGKQFSEMFKPLEMGPQPLIEYSFPEKTISRQSPEMESILRQKNELDSLYEDSQVKDLLVSFPQENAMGASSNALGYERFQFQSRGESSSGAAADKHQKQPMVATELPQWTWL